STKSRKTDWTARRSRQSPRSTPRILVWLCELCGLCVCRFKEVDDPVFRPIPIVLTRARTHEPAVSAMIADPHIDARIAGDLWIVEGARGHEWIVLGSDHERPDADSIDDPHCA